MNPINIKGTDDVPTVTLDKDKNVIEFSGRSLPEDVAAFYDPILAWIDEYAKSPNPKTTAVFKLDYFNTASSKMILDILMKFEDVKAAGSDTLIQWYFLEDDEDMQEAGEEYADIVDVPFEPIGY